MTTFVSAENERCCAPRLLRNITRHCSLRQSKSILRPAGATGIKLIFIYWHDVNINLTLRVWLLKLRPAGFTREDVSLWSSFWNYRATQYIVPHRQCFVCRKVSVGMLVRDTWCDLWHFNQQMLWWALNDQQSFAHNPHYLSHSHSVRLLYRL